MLLDATKDELAKLKRDINYVQSSQKSQSGDVQMSKFSSKFDGDVPADRAQLAPAMRAAQRKK